MANLYNSEGYFSPTEYEAFTNIEKDERAANFHPIVYICSPYSHGCINENVANARRYSRFAVDSHCIPFAPHLLFPQFMDDAASEERELAMFMNMAMLSIPPSIANLV